MNYYKFVQGEVIPFENIPLSSSKLLRALKEYDDNNKKPLKDMHYVTTNNNYKIQGWCIPLNSYLNTYWVKDIYGNIKEYYAMNKTDIRKEIGSHKVVKIMCLNQKTL